MTPTLDSPFAKIANHFEPRALEGEALKEFFVGDFFEPFMQALISAIHTSGSYQKLLLIGHRGCGKTTLLNKVAEELRTRYHLVYFSAGEVLNMMDVETVDILLATYGKVIESVTDESQEKKLLSRFKELIDHGKNKFQLDKKIDINAFFFRFTVESENRTTTREALWHRMDELQNSLSKACADVREETKKEVLIIIDNLDKLEDAMAQNVFLKGSRLLTLPRAKVLFTMPLPTFYNPGFIGVSDVDYQPVFIPLIALSDRDGNPRPDNLDEMEQVVLRRIDDKLVDKAALQAMILASGGLLRDLIKFMHMACTRAIVKGKMEGRESIIDRDIAALVIRDLVNQYTRVFDFPRYRGSITHIRNDKDKERVAHEDMSFFLNSLFALEYGHPDRIWYDLHPCLARALDKQ
uniref:AAA ATPase domain-containing protein n=1 Tax=Candidatus Kentrum sp. FW TaxID=2126338 RepID=A0A450RVP7_9GAMM|nr:MAG: AAA ATPase domain-containing protein [Candidatus Kentron sp. FW]